MYSPLLEQLITALRYLPGVGPRSAQRMALHLLARHRDKGLLLANHLQQAMQHIRHCEDCHDFSETTLCRICVSPARNEELLCIVESPADIIAIEQTGHYQGRYFVLMGHISPLDGIGPEQIGIGRLLQLIQKRSALQEVILATSGTVEGEATAQYIAELLTAKSLKTSRIAYGVPLGSELEHLDSGTLARALSRREVMETE